ncbi:hypothetical protein [Rhodococcoides fascians]|uniref:hypothetical protein n=1 Tax=Rhodococcoides fascians TaxID=1828 RepID=UPI00050C29D8|nr:hypothetical protein [Rhodococcus fascians]
MPRRRRLPLLDPVETQWGIYPRGHEVVVLGHDPKVPGGAITIAVDDSEQHTTVVASTALFEWPRRVQHGEPAGYELHKRHLERPCQRCTDTKSKRVRAKRLRDGAQAGLNVPVEFLAELLDNAPKQAWDRADALWGRETVDAVVGSR